MAYEEKIKTAARPHIVTMEEREKLSVSGVEDVESFDEKEIVVSTSKGSLIVRGSELRIGKLSLDSGELKVEGYVTDLSYEEPAPSGGIWSRLFK